MDEETLKRLFPKGSADFIARNLGGQSRQTLAGDPVAAKKRLRQNTKGMNKTEAAFNEFLQAHSPEARIYVQGVTLLICNGVRYTPDFFVRHPAGDQHAYEVKGFMRDDAAVKLKVAASAYPWIQFYLATKRKLKDGGGWIVQHVLP